MAGRTLRHVGGGVALAVIAALFLFAGAAQAKQSKSYTVTDLGTLPGGTESEASAINERGEVTGASEEVFVNWPPDDPNRCNVPCIGWRAFRYSDGAMTDLGGDPDYNYPYTPPSSFGYAINDAGDVAGFATSFSLDSHPAIWRNTTISILSRQDHNGAFGINNADDVVGTVVFDGCGDGSWLFRNGEITFINFPNGYGGGQANDVNNKGKVVGGACLRAPDQARHAYVYDNGTITDLGTLGGTSSTATAISDSDKIVGYSQVSGDAAEHAVRYQGGSIRDLGTLGGANSRALAVNKSGRIVGWSDSITGRTRAFLFSGSSMKDLNGYLAPDSGWVLEQATGINDKDEIVGKGTYNGNTRAFLLTPVR